MVRPLLLLILIVCSPGLAQGQHYQNIINQMIGCTTLTCIEQAKTQHKLLTAFTPVKKELNSNLSRYHFDFSWAYGAKEENKRKFFRLSLLLEQDAILFGQLEQWSNDSLQETTFLFRNNSERIEQLLKQQQDKKLTYQDLINSTTIRFSNLWMRTP